MYSLVADIGGTNSRFALSRQGEIELQEPRKYPNASFDSLAAVIEHYLKDVGIEPLDACLAVAGPAHKDDVALTNIDWTFSVSDYKRHFNLRRLLLTNDFTALAMSVPFQKPGSTKKLGNGEPVSGMPISVLGPGTGLGVSGLLNCGNQWVSLQGEGGNVDFCPANEEEVELLRLAWKDLSHVRAENFISGSGMSYLHDLRLELHGKPREGLKAEDIAWQAGTTECGICRDTINVFCGMLGSFAGNQALTLGALGGVYIGGGVAPQLEELFDKSPFRERFEAKGRFRDYVRPIPTYLLLSHSRNAMLGASAMLAQSEPLAHPEPVIA